MTPDRDDAATRRYREANAALDERPSASTRAAILAGAARHVEAKPLAAEAPRAAHRRRWPLAAAAAVLLSTLAVMMAQRTEQEMPTFTAPAERSQEKVAVAPAQPAPASDPATGASASPSTVPVAPASPSRAATQNDAGAASRPGAFESGAPAKKSAPADAAGEIAAPPAPSSRSEPPAIAPASRAKAAREQEAASAEAPQALPVAPAPAAPPPPVQKPRVELGAAGSVSDAAKSDPSPAYRAARKEIAPAPAAAPSAQGAVAADAQRDVELSARDWLDRIVRLRGEGRHADADAELKRFRERYPDVQVPVAALPPGAPATGTR